MTDEFVETQMPLPIEDMNAQEPLLVPLRRESVPVKRFGKIVSFKTSYSGIVKMGTPPTEYRVVFDTGSGHLILPDARCQTDACLNGKKSIRYESIHNWSSHQFQGSDRSTRSQAPQRLHRLWNWWCQSSVCKGHYLRESAKAESDGERK